MLAAIAAAGHEVALVGGCVRDRLLGSEGGWDWDAATSARPEVVAGALRSRHLGEPIRHGDHRRRAAGGGHLVPRRGRVRRSAPPGRGPLRGLARPTTWPDATSPSTPSPGCRATWPRAPAGVLDPFGGRATSRRASCAPSATPRERFDEDALRLVRAARFAGRFEMTIDPATEAAIGELAPHGGLGLGRARPRRAAAHPAPRRAAVARACCSSSGSGCSPCSSPSSPRCAASRRPRRSPGDALDHTLAAGRRGARRSTTRYGWPPCSTTSARRRRGRRPLHRP